MPNTLLKKPIGKTFQVFFKGIGRTFSIAADGYKVDGLMVVGSSQTNITIENPLIIAFSRGFLYFADLNYCGKTVIGQT